MLTLVYRYGGGSTGWSRAWIINLLARLFEPDMVHDNLVIHLNAYTYASSLMDTGPPAPYQVDGNFGGIAGMAEALLQSHETMSPPGGNATKSYLLRLLPALPKAWGQGDGGYVKGLLARGGFEVDISWSSSGTLVSANITSKLGNEVYVTCGGHNITAINIAGVGSGEQVLLRSAQGKTYSVVPQTQ